MKECPSSSCAPANSERRRGTRDKQRALAIQCVWRETAKDASPVPPGCAAYSHQEQEIKTFPAYPPEQPPGSLLVLDLDSRTFQRVVLWSEKQQLTRGNRRATTLTMNAHLQQTKKLEARERASCSSGSSQQTHPSTLTQQVSTLPEGESQTRDTEPWHRLPTTKPEAIPLMFWKAYMRLRQSHIWPWHTVESRRGCRWIKQHTQEFKLKQISTHWKNR